MNSRTVKRLVNLGWKEEHVNRIHEFFHPKRKGKYKMTIYDIDDLDQDPEDGIWVETTFFDNDTDLSIIHYFFEGLAYVMTVAESGEEIGRGIIDFAPFEEMSDFENKEWEWMGYDEVRELTKDKTARWYPATN